VIKSVIILVLRAISLSHAAEHRSAFLVEDLEKRGERAILRKNESMSLPEIRRMSSCQTSSRTAGRQRGTK